MNEIKKTHKKTYLFLILFSLISTFLFSAVSYYNYRYHLVNYSFNNLNRSFYIPFAKYINEDNPEAASDLIRGILEKYKDINGMIYIHFANIKNETVNLHTSPGLTARADKWIRDTLQTDEGFADFNKAKHEFRVPAEYDAINFSFDIQKAGRPLGYLRIGYNYDIIKDEAWDLTLNLIYVGLFLFLIAYVFVVLMNVFITRAFESFRFDVSNEVRDRTKKEVYDKFKQQKERESKMADDSPLDSTEFFGLLDASRKINATFDMTEILRISITSIVKIMGVREAMIYMFDETNSFLEAKISYETSAGIIQSEELQNIKINIGQGETGMIAETGTTAVVDTPVPGAAVISAITSRGNVVGVFKVKNKVDSKPFGKKDKLLARQFSGIIGNAVYNAYLYNYLSAGGQ